MLRDRIARFRESIANAPSPFVAANLERQAIVALRQLEELRERCESPGDDGGRPDDDDGTQPDDDSGSGSDDGTGEDGFSDDGTGV